MRGRSRSRRSGTARRPPGRPRPAECRHRHDQRRAARDCPRPGAAAARRRTGQAEAKATVLDEQREDAQAAGPAAARRSSSPTRSAARTSSRWRWRAWAPAGDVGEPGLPDEDAHSSPSPRARTSTVEVSNVKSYTLKGVELYPRQEQPVDGGKGDVPIRSPTSGRAVAHASTSRRSSSTARPTTRTRSSRPRPPTAGRWARCATSRSAASSAAGGQYQPKTKHARRCSRRWT